MPKNKPCRKGTIAFRCKLTTEEVLVVMAKEQNITMSTLMNKLVEKLLKEASE